MPGVGHKGSDGVRFQYRKLQTVTRRSRHADVIGAREVREADGGEGQTDRERREDPRDRQPEAAASRPSEVDCRRHAADQGQRQIHTQRRFRLHVQR